MVGKKKKIVLLLLSFLICVCLSENSIEYAQDSVFYENHLLETEIVLINDVVEEDKCYAVTGIDGYLVYKLQSEGELWNAQLEFQEALPQSTEFQIFYADDSCQFSQENSFHITVAQGASEAVFSFPNENIKYIRVDIIIPEDREISMFNLNVSAVGIENYVKSIISFQNILQIGFSIVALMFIYLTICKLWKDGRDKSYLLILLLLVTSMFVILYHSFISGKYTYIYLDIGSDTIHQYWPKYLFNLDFFREIGNSGYTLQKGLGEYAAHVGGSFLNPFDWTFLVFEETYALIFSLYIKIVWTSCFAWAYFKKKFQRQETAIICAVLWSFCGWMVLWGQHYHFATTYAYVTAIMFFLELMLSKSKYCMLLSIPLALLTGHSYYFTYMMGIFCVIYIILTGVLKKWSIKETFGMIVKLGIAEVVAMLLSAIQLYPAIDGFLHSGRTGALEISWGELLKPRSLGFIIAYIGRMLSTNMWGLQIYSGPLNYYEMTISYISVLSIMAIVYFFLTKYWKRMLLAITIYGVLIMIPLVSKLLQFDINSFRWTVILCIGVVLLTGCFLEELWIKLENQELSILKKTLLLSNLVIICLVGVLLIVHYKNYFDFQLHKEALIQFGIMWLLAVVLAMTMIILKKYNPKKIAMCILIFVCIEQVFMNYNVVNNRGELSRDIVEYGLYNDGTANVVDELKEKDLSLYRLNKTYYSVFYNDAYVQDYYGLATYNSANSNALSEFVDFLEIEKLNDSSNYIAIKAEHKFVNELLAVKYLVARQGEVVSDNYVEVQSNSAYVVYEDTHALPFGYLYTKQLDVEDIENFKGTEARSAALMTGFYVKENIEGFETVELESETLAEFADKGREQLRDSKVYEQAFVDNCYSAKVVNDTDDKAMLCIPLIYSERWKASIDGTQVECYNINGGLVGVEIPEGEFDVVVEYEDQDYEIATYITIGAAIIYMIGTAIILTKFRKRNGIIK